MERCTLWYKYLKEIKKSLKNIDQEFSFVENYA